MKLRRRLLISVAACAAVLAIACGVVASSAFQTWAVRRYLAEHPDLHLSVGRVAAGFHHVRLTGIAFANARVRAQVPRLDADMDVAAFLLHRQLNIAELVAGGWTAELIRSAAKPAGSERGPNASSEVSDRAVVTPTVQPTELRGLLAQLRLPFATTLGAVDADGAFQFGTGTAKLHLTGGGFGAGRAGTLRYTIDAERSGASPAVVHLTGSGVGIMGSELEFTQLQLRFEATASGGKLEQAVTVQTQLEVTRTGNVERYGVALSGKRPLISATAELAEGARSLSGNWSIDLTDADVEPFALGRPMPAFAATGSGRFDADTTLISSHLSGTIAVAIDRLGVLNHSFDDVGPVKLTIDTDVAQRGTLISVVRLNAGIVAADAPVGTIRALQPFEFDPRTRALHATNAAAPLLGVTIDGLPLRWARPFLGNFEIEGDALRGELTATPRSGGLSFATRAPVSISHLSIGREKQPWLRDVEISATLAGDYMPQGWQLECRDLTVRAATGAVALVNARAGRLAGADQPLKATGHATIDFAALGTQPIAAPIASVGRGSGAVDFAAAWGRTADWQSTIELKNLVATPGDRELPAVKGTFRASLDVNRKVTINAPFAFEREGRVSDLTLAGSCGAELPLRFDARVSSANLVLGDLGSIGAAFPPRAEGEAGGGLLFSNVTGTATLDLKHVTAGSGLDLTNVSGTIHCGAGAMTFENLHATTQGGGEATIVAAIRHESAHAFGLQADVAATEFNAAPWFRAIDPRQPPTIEGRFTVTSKLTARANSLSRLPGAALGEVECTSKGGVFRGLAVNVGNLVENSSKLLGWLAAAGDAIKSPFIGRKDQDEITSRAQAAHELARLLSNVTYDQLGIVILREESDVARVKEFTLISPELRIRGAGVTRRDRGTPLSRQFVDLDLTLRARGRTAELMKYLGILEKKTDDLGYAGCTIPVHVEGALDRPDTTQLSNRLVALAVEKTGLTEKAVDWINRLRGKTAN